MPAKEFISLKKEMNALFLKCFEYISSENLIRNINAAQVLHYTLL